MSMNEEYTVQESLKKGDKAYIDEATRTIRLVQKETGSSVSVADTTQPVHPLKISDIPNADIIEVMQTFERVLDVKLRPVDEQRRYAKFLIKDYTKEKVLGSIVAIELMRGKPFSPSITSLKELHFKWGKLVDFYRRNQPQPSKVTNLDDI